MKSPKEQYIISLVAPYITNLVLLKLFVGILTLVLAGSLDLSPNNWGILSESLFRTSMGQKALLGPRAMPYLPLFYTIFHFILFSNLIGLIPYSSTPTVEILLTLAIAITLLAGILFIGFLTQGVKALAIFLPGGTPLGLIPLKIILEIIAYLFRTLSLGLRLAINLITGHILAKVIIGFIWMGYIKGPALGIALGIALLTLFLALEILIAYLQAYLFIFITIITFKDVT